MVEGDARKVNKRKTHRRWWLMGIVLFCGLMLLPANKAEVNAAVRMNYTSIKLGQGKSKQLLVKGTKAKIKWSSSNTKVVTVENGLITAQKGGKATITAKVGTKKLRCAVTVVGLNKTMLTLSKKSTYTLKVKNGKNTTWKTSDKTIVSVNSKGVIKAKNVGKAVITCKSNGRTIKCKVYVPELNAATQRIPMGSNRQLIVSNCGDYTPVWTSYNPAIATVDANGLVTSVALGSTTVSCKVGTVTMKCNVMVTNPGDITTPMSSLPLNSAGDKLSVTVEGFDTSRTYTVFRQNSTCNKSTVYPKYMSGHGCAACSLTTVLMGYKGLNITPSYTVEAIEKNVLGSAYTSNYKKYSNTSSKDKSMPISLYGISRVLSAYGIPNQYVRSFSDVQALDEITQHLKTGNAVVIEVKKFNRSTGQTDTTWSNSYHTMVLLGMTDTGMAIVADSADRSSTIFGACKRIKYATVASLIPYMFSCTNVTSTSNYFTSAGGGGYILVNPE